MSPLAAWILSLMLSLQPSAPWSNTFASTAAAIERAAILEPIFMTPERTAAILVSLAWYESRFKQDAVDPTRSSFCLLQLDGTNIRGLGMTREEVLSNPDACLKAGMSVLRTSSWICRDHPFLDRLAYYSSRGPTCSIGGALRSQLRVGTGLELLRRLPPPPSAEPALPSMPDACEEAF